VIYRRIFQSGTILFFLALATFSAPAIELTHQEQAYLKNKGVVTFVSQKNYPPFEFLNANNQAQGMSIELAQWLATELGFKARFIAMTFQEAQDAVIRGEADVITSLFYSKKRDATFDFTVPVFMVPADIFVQADRPDIRALEDLQNKRVAMQEGDYAQEFLASKNISYTPVLVDDFASAADLVITGEADALIGDRQIVLFHLFSSHLEDQLKTVGKPLYIGDCRMATRHGEQMLTSILNLGLREARSRGIFQQIYYKWLGKSLTEKTWLQYHIDILIYLFAALLLAALSILLFNRRLKQLLQKQTRELTEKTVRLESILSSSSNMAIITTDPSMNIIYANDSASKIFALDFTSLLGHNLMELDTGAKLFMESEPSDYDKKRMKYGEHHHLSITRTTADGARVLEIDITQSTDSNGEMSGYVVVCHDVTEHARAVEAISISEHRLDGVLRAAPIGIGLVIDRVIQWTNDELAVITGYAPQELVGIASRQLYESEEEFLRVGQTGLHQQNAAGQACITTRFKRKDSTYVDVLLNSSPVDPNDLSRGAIFAIIDISDRIKAEAELKQREHYLIALTDIYQLLLKSTTGIPYQPVINLIGQVACVRRAAIFLFRQDADGHERTMLLADWHSAELTTSLAERPDLQQLPFALAPEIRERLKSGQSIHARPSEMPEALRALLKPLDVHTLVLLPLIIDSHGIGYFAFDTDSSDTNISSVEERFLSIAATALSNAIHREQTSDAQNQLERQVHYAQKLESLGVLTGGIAHDFNNMLMAILGNADMALTDLAEDHPATESVREIEIGARRAAELTQQMLDYSGQGMISMQSVNLSNVVRDMLQLLIASISASITFETNLSDDLPSIKADPAQLQQIILNLVTNAAESIPDERAGQVEIITSKRTCTQNDFKDSLVGNEADGYIPTAGEYISVEVHDNGHGMDQETINKIFNPFFSTKFLGRGLGLASVLGIVRKHHGAILLESTVDVGTRIKVLFPAISDSQLNLKQLDLSSPPPTSPSSTSPANRMILLVDDEPDVLSIAERMLKRFGFEVFIANDGQEAVSIFLKNFDKIDCVILDLTMPKMSGTTTFRELRAIRSDIKVIISSGYSVAEMAKRFAGQGPDAFIQKPYLTSSLRATIRRILQG